MQNTTVGSAKEAVQPAAERELVRDNAESGWSFSSAFEESALGEDGNERENCREGGSRDGEVEGDGSTRGEWCEPDTGLCSH